MDPKKLGRKEEKCGCLIGSGVDFGLGLGLWFAFWRGFGEWGV